MLQLVESSGIFGGYLEDLCYTPKLLKSVASVKAGSIGRVLWAKSRETHPGPHSDWFWDKEKSGGGAIIDLACHCVEISRNFIGKDVKPIEVMCWADTQVHPIEAEDHAIGLVKYANGAIGQFEVSWTFRGGLDLRDEVMGTEGTIWLNSFLRTGFEMFTTGKGGSYVAEKAESTSGWLFPVGDESHELGYPNMFTDMFDAIEKKRQPSESFYDGYVVNAILDAAFLSAKTKKWEPVVLTDWRGEEATEEKHALVSFDDTYYLVKEEILPNGDQKIILKNKLTGEIIQKNK
jgi:predicted dehydrogenase